jgi:hypothetical protein
VIALMFAGCAPMGLDEPFVVLELFTSQSCSSCPPADQDLNALAEDPASDTQRIYPIAWHVDYWNNLGWVDPYSSAEASDRQRTYTSALDWRTFTPQMVANGQEYFVASRDDEREAAIERWLDRDSPAAVHLTLREPAHGVWPIEVTVEGAPVGTELVVALLHSDIVTFVPSGENAGETLTHHNVVRTTVYTDPVSGEVLLEIPPDVPPESASVVGFLQDRTNRAILAADLAR